MVKISIIIPVWNLWHMTKDCLESIAQSCAKDEILDSIEVIVVDNHSTDTTCTALAPTLTALFGKQGHVITHAENLGFAKACNAGAHKAKAPLLFFLNNDTVMTENCLPPLMQALERNQNLGIVGPLLLYPGNKIQHAGIAFSPTLELVHAHHLIPAASILASKQRFWQAITGAAMLMPAKIFKECEGFHEGYINGFEDLDLCAMVRQKGFKLTVIHKSILYHHTSQTPGRFANDSANSALLGKRCAGYFRPDLHKIALEAGLEPQLSPDLELYISLSHAKEKALNLVFSQNFHEERCKNRLDAEPYWLSGYELLGTYYEHNGRWNDALDVRLQQARLAPLKEHFGSLAFCAANCKASDLVEHGKQCLVDVIQKTKDMNALQHKATSLKNWALQNDDPELAQIFERWLEKYTI